MKPNAKSRKNKTDKISAEFAEILRKRLKERLRKTILFGSHARGDFTEGSDYDFLVVVDKREKRIQEIVLDASVEILNKHYALIGCIVCDEEEWERKKRFPIGLNILKEGIEL
ncbi:MAG TPA: nucleotidyltransferase domain-containing protein [Candidatus Brocadiia bacterium]|nr:nucleotidyltransferase domain-containing protein [Candidatus Brocadiales bacterium]